MRPDCLTPLFATLGNLKGIGPRVAQHFNRLLGIPGDDDARLLDLAFHLPASVIDRRHQPGISGATSGEIVTLRLIVEEHLPPPGHKKTLPYRVMCHDNTGTIELVFFHVHGNWLERSLPQGELRMVSGQVEWFNSRAQMVHPDFILTEQEFETHPLVETVYPLTAGLSGKVLKKIMAQVIDRIPVLPEWQNGPWLVKQDFPTFGTALVSLHTPEQPTDFDPESVSWRRLAYDEYLASQLALALVRRMVRKGKGIAHRFDGNIATRLLSALPFTLTQSQQVTIAEIETDLQKPERMLRLVQGDVGSGKTIIALFAMAAIVESGYQASMMAPTELLARQHFASLKPLANAAGMSITVLTGKDKGKARKEIESSIASGEVDIVIGTHALFQSTIIFKNLGLAVIDEQHRFGVHQRLALAEKGMQTDMLVMTATPIPRTLVLSYFGDMDVSVLTEKPAGRQPIDTRTLSVDRIDDLVARLKSRFDSGAKAYWVCPLVEENEESDLTSAEERHNMLQKIFGDRVELVHGRMKPAEKDTVMQRFRDGKTQILVATTVIEVGVDVPDATIMIIEHAERFGLSQLHQLRGRVGRSDAASSCLLLFMEPLGVIAKERLNIMRQTDDGFQISEKDLELRGEGDVLGTRQSGTPGFRLARVEHHKQLIEVARDDARLIIETDPELVSERGKALRVLLYLFGRDDAIRLLRSG